MKWIMCFQTPYNMVEYMTSEMDGTRVEFFKDFLKFTDTLNLEHYDKFKGELDRFQTIVVDVESKSWSIYENNHRKNPTFEELLELNKDIAVIKDSRKDEKENQEKTQLEIMKDSIEKYARKKGKEFDNPNIKSSINKSGEKGGFLRGLFGKNRV